MVLARPVTCPWPSCDPALPTSEDGRLRRQERAQQAGGRVGRQTDRQSKCEMSIWRSSRNPRGKRGAAVDQKGLPEKERKRNGGSQRPSGGDTGGAIDAHAYACVYVCLLSLTQSCFFCLCCSQGCWALSSSILSRHLSLHTPSPDFAVSWMNSNCNISVPRRLTLLPAVL